MPLIRGTNIKTGILSMAHLWFANPLSAKGMSRLFATHPPIPARIERLHTMGGQF